MPKMKDYYAVRDAVDEWVGSSTVPKRFPTSWGGWVLAMSTAVNREQRELNPRGDVELTDETELGPDSSRVLENLKAWLRKQSSVFKNI